MRRRLFIVGLLKGKRPFEFPTPTHERRDQGSQQKLRFTEDHVTVVDAISDLPQNGSGRSRTSVEDDEKLPYLSSPRSLYQKLMRNGDVAVTGNKITIHVPHILEAISALKQGEEERATRYRRLFANRPAFTLRAGSGSFTALRPIHPTRDRVITVREAARLQSFPDWVHVLRPQKSGHIRRSGVSVPPLLGKAIASKLREYLS